jgi:hypothetical protein
MYRARPFTDPDAAARKLELAKTIEPMQDSRIHIERIDGPFPFPLKVGTGI